MAPDINSLPPSPYRPNQTSTSSYPRASSDLRVPTQSQFLPSQPQSPISPFRDHAPLPTSSAESGLDNTGVGTGPGPLRHPRPLTAADLHMQLEKEQEAVVNRLTRELSLLRQQSASVASTASSASNSLPDVGEHLGNTIVNSADHHMRYRRHRSSSSLSARSANVGGTGHGIGSSGTSQLPTTAGLAGTSSSGIAPPRDSSIVYTYPRDPLSRQSSVASRRSETSSPSLSSSLIQGEHFPNAYTRRYSGSTSQTQQGVTLQASPNASAGRPLQIPSTQRYEEAHHARAELEIARKENEELRGRIRDLERLLRQRQHDSEASQSSNGRNERGAADNSHNDHDTGRGTGASEDVNKVDGLR